MLEAQTGGRKLAPEVRQVLLDAHSEHYFDMLHAFNVMQGMGAIGDALGSGAEYALRKAGLDRATARNIHRAINDGLTVTGVAGAVKGVAKVGARGASSSAKAATRTSLDGLGLEGAGGQFNRNLNRQFFQDHHIISNKHPLTQNHPLWELAGMDPNARANMMFLPTVKGANISSTTRSIHQGRHYEGINARLAQKMDTVRERGLLNSWTQTQYADQLKKIISSERTMLRSGARSLNKNKRSWAND